MAWAVHRELLLCFASHLHNLHNLHIFYIYKSIHNCTSLHPSVNWRSCGLVSHYRQIITLSTNFTIILLVHFLLVEGKFHALCVRSPFEVKAYKPIVLISWSLHRLLTCKTPKHLHFLTTCANM